MLHGRPGVGKTEIVESLAREIGARLFDLRLTTIEPQDLRGLPYYDHETRKTQWYRPEDLPDAPDTADPAGGYVAWWLAQHGFPALLGVPVAGIVMAGIGWVAYKLVIRRVIERDLFTSLLATFGLSLVLQQLVRTTISAQNVIVSNPAWMSGALEINPALSLTYNRLYVILFSLIVLGLLMLVLKRTSLGLQVRAVAQNRSMAKAVGIRSDWVDAMTFGLGSGIAGVAGVALSQLTNVGPNMGQAYIIDSFMVVVFGGVGNLWGTLVGAMSLGVANKFLEPWSGAVLAKILVLVFIILFIQKRPRGLFPQRGRAAEG